MYPLSRSIATRVHCTHVQGAFAAYSVENQGCAPLSTFRVSTKIDGERLAMTIADVCDSTGGEDYRLETLAEQVTRAALEHARSADWSTLETLVETEPYVGVTLTVLVCEPQADGFFDVTLTQLGKTVDVWCLRRMHDDNDDYDAITMEQWSSREEAFAEIPLSTPIATDHSRLAHLPVHAALGAGAFGDRVSHQPCTIHRRVHLRDVLFLHSNGFEPNVRPAAPVETSLPCRLHASYARDAQYDGNWLEVLDDEALNTVDTARNRYIGVIELHLGSGVAGMVKERTLRAGRYLPGDRRFERAFAHHCKRLGTNKVEMITLYNEQCGVMAEADVTDVLHAICASDYDDSDEYDDGEEEKKDEYDQVEEEEFQRRLQIDDEESDTSDWSYQPYWRSDWDQ